MSILLSAVLLIVLAYLSWQLIDAGKEAREYKYDYATLHSVKYGMFNSDIWVEKIRYIVDQKIDGFNLNTTNKEEVKRYIQTIIDTLVLEAQRIVKERNRGKRGFFDSILGSTKQMITDSLIDFKDLRRRVPEFTNAVMAEVEKPENQERAKKLIRQKLKIFMAQNFKKSTDLAAYNAVLKKYNTNTLQECNSILDKRITHIKDKMKLAAKQILALSLGIVVLVFLQGYLCGYGLVALFLTTAILLVLGIMMPMLDIEAKIDKLSFAILDKNVIFENQILFFQSKSISDLVSLLLYSDEARMILVGILLVMFSIIFPLLKLVATTLYFYSKSIVGNNPVTRFFALKSTKWSMADVFVVSIFMAYLGLDGVVSSELDNLELQGGSINIITTNGTQLEVGFFLFLGFVAVSFVLSMMVEYKVRKS